jgi:hypothetical protein
MKGKYSTKILTDGNFNHKHGFATPSAIAIKGNDIVGSYFGFLNLDYPCSIIAECSAIKMGFDMATNYCDKRKEEYERGSAVIESDNIGLVNFLNGKKLIKKNGMTKEIERILEEPKNLIRIYRIKVRHKNHGKGMPHDLSKAIESLLLEKVGEYRSMI